MTENRWLAPLLIKKEMKRAATNNKHTYPLWYLLSPENRGKLAAYQWEVHGVMIAIPDFPYAAVNVETRLVNTREVMRTMKQKPNAVRGQFG